MALDYDGIDDVVGHGDIAGVDGAANFTAMCWLYVDALEALASFLNKAASGGTNTFQFGTSNVDSSIVWVYFDASAANKGETATGAIAAGSWNHWAFTYDGSGGTNDAKLDIYKNGVSQSLSFGGTIPATLVDSGTAIIETGVNRREGVFYDCRIAHVKMWTGTLTASAIGQEMVSYRPVRRSNLILWGPYDDGIRARDYSGGGNHGTVTGALHTGGPQQIPKPERFATSHKRRAHVGLWGHRVTA